MTSHSSKERTKFLFGPVKSRRLGVSLGVDLTPFKTCSLDCIYCECGATTTLTCERSEYFPVKSVIEEIKKYLEPNPTLDFITFSGSGEPTLYSKLGEVIRFIKSDFPSYKLALITNSVLLSDAKVREDVRDVDIVMPSLDAVTQEIFEKINRPSCDIKVQDIINGLSLFRYEFKGEMWLEIFIVPGINDTETELEAIKKTLLEINPHRIQLNSLDRPGTCNWIRPPNDSEIAKIKDFLFPLPVEVISSKRVESQLKKHTNHILQNIDEVIISTISRRPSTIDDLVVATSSSSQEIQKHLDLLLKKNLIKTREEKRGLFFYKV